MIIGYWLGENTASFTGVTYQVNESPNPTHWQNRHVGKRRQALKVSYRGQVFLLDNEHGDAFFKVTEGMGSPAYSHKGIENPSCILDIPDKKINRFYNGAAIKAENERHDRWTEAHYPDAYKKILAIREQLKDSVMFK